MTRTMDEMFIEALEEEEDMEDREHTQYTSDPNWDSK